jgi:hypothetical protein
LTVREVVVYLDNQEDRELLLSSTLVLRNKSVNFYTRNPRYAFKEKTDTTKVRVKDIPLSADDGQIIKALEDHHSFSLWPFPRHLEHLSFSAHGLGWP